MVKLNPIIPSENFEAGPNMKLYPGAMRPALLNALNKESFKGIDITQIWDSFPECKNITFIRHLESIYNDYKKVVREDPKYIEFNQTEDPERKWDLARELLNHYRKNIGVDFSTGISEEGKRQWETYGKLYAELVNANPEIFPTLIIISPYLRTRMTAHYFLKYVKWLEIDLDKLIDTNNKQDLIIGKFQGKDISIRLSNRVRERDHGSAVAPSFLREYIDSTDPYSPSSVLSEDEEDIQYYFNAPIWWESQVQVEDRIKVELNSIMTEKHQNILVVSHHIAILAVLNTIFAGSMNTYYNIDRNRRPDNGSLTVISEIPVTRTGQKDKLRVSAYNLKLGE